MGGSNSTTCSRIGGPTERSTRIAPTPFGAGRFYTGQIGLGLLQLFVVLATGIGALWPIIDGIMLLSNGGLDAQGRPLRP